jgi:hypothetical protein
VGSLCCFAIHEFRKDNKSTDSLFLEIALQLIEVTQQDAAEAAEAAAPAEPASSGHFMNFVFDTAISRNCS